MQSQEIAKINQEIKKFETERSNLKEQREQAEIQAEQNRVNSQNQLQQIATQIVMRDGAILALKGLLPEEKKEEKKTNVKEVVDQIKKTDISPQEGEKSKTKK